MAKHYFELHFIVHPCPHSLLPGWGSYTVSYTAGGGGSYTTFPTSPPREETYYRGGGGLSYTACDCIEDCSVSFSNLKLSKRLFWSFGSR